VAEVTIRPGSEDEDRYDRSRRIPWLDVDAVFRSRVLMVGAGALGNEVAKNLALSGFRDITIVDMDHVVRSNLNRCLFFNDEHARSRTHKAVVIAEGIRSLSDESRPVAVVGRVEDLEEKYFREADVILGCLDNIRARLDVNARAYAARKPYIDGGMDGFIGKVSVIRPPDGACLQCGMNRSHSKVAGLRFSCTGEGMVFHEPKLSAEITTTSVVSAVMVRECLKSVSGRKDMMLANAFYYDGQRNVMEEIEIPVDPMCPNHADQLQVSERHLTPPTVK